MQISFEIILCACVCISSQAIVTQKGSVSASSVHISMRICTKTSVLKLFLFQVSWSWAGVKKFWEEEVFENVELTPPMWRTTLSYDLTSDVLLKPAVLLSQCSLKLRLFIKSVSVRRLYFPSVKYCYEINTRASNSVFRKGRGLWGQRWVNFNDKTKNCLENSFTGIYSSRIRLQEGEEWNQAEEKNERLLINDEAYCRGEVV